MRKILALSICLLLLPVAVFANTSLLNYEKEAVMSGKAVCDNGQTSVTLYEHLNYDVYVAAASLGATYLFFDTDNGEKYYVGSGNNAMEMKHEAWDAKLKSDSPGWYAFLHGGQHDCRDGS